MNVEFATKMLEAKRLEAEALALLLPPDVREIGAAAVRACAQTALVMLEGEPRSQAHRPAQPSPKPERQTRGMRSIDIE